MVDEKLAATSERIEVATVRLKKLQEEQQKLEAERNKILLDEYLPVLQSINLTPQELKEFFAEPKKSENEVTNAY